jgi:hypothetical protein
MGSKGCWSLVISLALINALAASNTTSRLCGRVQGRAAETAETVGREVVAVVVAAAVVVMVGREGEGGRWLKGDIRRVVVGEGRGASGGGGGDRQGI